LNEPTFIDLFSGIGGFRLGLERVGFKCVWSCDNDVYANRIYAKNFGTENHHAGDVRRVDAKGIPDHNLLCAGFPCQAFSIAGKQKGFEDTRGTLFFEICRIAEAKKPPLLLLENVKGLLSHDKGFTFQVILESLEELGYWVEWQVLNSRHFGVPQNRERVFIIGHLGGRGGREVFPIAESPEVATREPRRPKESVSTCIVGSYWKGADKHGQRTLIIEDFYKERGTRTYVEESPTLRGDRHGLKLVIPTLNDRARLEKRQRTLIAVVKSGSQTNRIYSPEGLSPTIPTPCGGRHIPIIKVGNIFPSGHEAGGILDPRGISETPRPMGSRGSSKVQAPKVLAHTVRHDMRIRRLTPVECERLQGFPDGWTEGVSDTQRYKLLGNAVTVNVIEFLGARILDRCFQ